MCRTPLGDPHALRFAIIQAHSFFTSKTASRRRLNTAKGNYVCRIASAEEVEFAARFDSSHVA
jgi:hypothetical protein